VSKFEGLNLIFLPKFTNYWPFLS